VGAGAGLRTGQRKRSKTGTAYSTQAITSSTVGSAVMLNIPASRVQVSIDTSSVNTRDAQQDVQLRGPDFFDVAHFPVMNFVSTRVERTGAHALRITGDVTLRGITRPMVLAVEVTQDLSQAGPVAARFTATGQIKRSQFGMPKYLDITGDTVEIRISANAVR